MKKLLKVAIFVGFLAGLGVGGYYGWKAWGAKKERSEEKAEKKEETQKVEEAPVPVKVVKAVRGDLPLRLTFSGQADCWEKATVKAETSGKVLRILKPVGSWVKKGELLAVLDDKEKRLALEKAKAAHLKALADYITTFRLIKTGPLITEKDRKRLEQAKKKYEEVLAKYRAGACSREELRKAEEELQITMIETGALQEQVRKATKGLTDAEISLRQAELEVEKTRIRAPFSGIIADIKVSPGQEVSAGTEVFRIVNPRSLYVRAFALEGEVGKIRKGMTARIKFLAFPDRFFRGRINAISPELDPEKKTATVFLSVLDPAKGLRPGMSCDVQVEYKVLKNVVKVPRKAVLVRSGRPLVFVVKDNVALWRYIKMGAQNEEEVEVKEGVEEGDLVVVEGQLTLAHQSRVKIVQ